MKGFTKKHTHLPCEVIDELSDEFQPDLSQTRVRHFSQDGRLQRGDVRLLENTHTNDVMSFYLSIY